MGSLVILLFVDASRANVADSSFALKADRSNFGLYFPTYLANGFLSVYSSIRATDPTPSYLVGLMDYSDGDVSRPAAIPSWSEIDYFDGRAWLNRAPLTAEALDEYGQILNMYDGTLATSYRWRDGARSSQISVMTFVSERDVHIGVTSLTVTPGFDGPAVVRFTLRPFPVTAHRLPLARLTWPETETAVANAGETLKPTSPTEVDRAALWYSGTVKTISAGGSAAARLLWFTGQAIHGAKMAEATAISLPPGLTPTQVKLRTTPAALVLEVSVKLRHGVAYRFGKYVSVARDDWGGSTATDQINRAIQARAIGAERLLREHRSAWHRLWNTDIVVDGDPQLQQVIHSDLFYLLENSSVNTRWPIGANGFSPHYLYHIFWDSDSWDLPVLLLMRPDAARSLAMFRARTLAPAQARAQARGLAGVMYPWESDPDRGTEQVPYFAHDLSDREIHINGDVAIAQWQYYLATGDVDFLRRYGYPVIRQAAEFWVSRVVHNASADRYEILGVTSPDEDYTNIPNDTFTNAVAQKTLRIVVSAAKILGEDLNPVWRRIADGMYIPSSETERRHLDFDPSVSHDKKTWFGSSLALLAYPQLDLEMPSDVRKNDFEFQKLALRESAQNINQMMLVMVSIQAAALGDESSSYEWLERNARGAYLKPPFNVRSENPANNNTYFLTSAAGFLQCFLYGFSGLRFTDDGLMPKYEPVLPAAWKSITLKNVWYLGAQYNYVIARDTTGAARLQRYPTMP